MVKIVNKPKKCECGCGKNIEWKPYHKYHPVRFIKGHQTRGKNHPSYGKNPTIETRNKMSNSHKDIRPSIETRKKMSESQKGIKPSTETKNKMSDAHKGIPTWNKGLTKKTDKRVKSMADSKIGKTRQ